MSRRPEQDDPDSDAEDDTYEEAIFDEATPFVPQDTPEDLVPLSDQAAVEHEAEQWALLWKEESQYDQQFLVITRACCTRCCPTPSEPLRPLFLLALDLGTTTFPRDVSCASPTMPLLL